MLEVLVKFSITVFYIRSTFVYPSYAVFFANITQVNYIVRLEWYILLYNQVMEKISQVVFSFYEYGKKKTIRKHNFKFVDIDITKKYQR